jgi:hypothetical protein
MSYTVVSLAISSHIRVSPIKVHPSSTWTIEASVSENWRDQEGYKERKSLDKLDDTLTIQLIQTSHRTEQTPTVCHPNTGTQDRRETDLERDSLAGEFRNGRLELLVSVLFTESIHAGDPYRINGRKTRRSLTLGTGARGSVREAS